MFKLLYTGFNVYDKKSSRINIDDYVGKEAKEESPGAGDRSFALNKRREAITELERDSRCLSKEIQQTRER